MTVLTLTAAVVSYSVHDSRKADRENHKAESGTKQIRFAAREVACRAGAHLQDWLGPDDVFCQHSKQQLRTQAQLPRPPCLVNHFVFLILISCCFLCLFRRSLPAS
jgi:hypothetical protein